MSTSCSGELKNGVESNVRMRRLISVFLFFVQAINRYFSRFNVILNFVSPGVYTEDDRITSAISDKTNYYW